jgi:hypothetical protein
MRVHSGHLSAGMLLTPLSSARSGSAGDWDDVAHASMMQLLAEAETQGWVQAVENSPAYGPDLVAELGDQTCLGWLYHCQVMAAGAPNSVITELGSNWGAFSFVLRRFFGSVHSIDANADKLAFQALVARQNRIRNIQFIHSNPTETPLPDACSDLVLVNLPRLEVCGAATGPHCRPPRAAILGEAARLVSAQGQVCVLGAGSASRIEGELNQAGLHHAVAYWAWPRSDLARISGSLDAQSVQYMIGHLSNLMKRKVMRHVAQLGCHIPSRIVGQALRLYSPGLIVVAAKEAWRSRNNVLHAGESFVRMTLAPRPQRNVHTTCLTLHASGVNQAIRIAEQCDAAGKAFFTCQAAPGISGRPLRSYAAAEADAAARWLADYHSHTCSGTWGLSALEDEMDLLCENVLRHRNEWIAPSQLAHFRRCYYSAASLAPWPIVAEHGDFTPTNILIEQTGQLHVLDWEYCCPQGNPLIDLGAFCLSMLRRTFNGRATADARAAGLLDRFLTMYSPGSQLPVTLAPAYYILRWLARISNPRPGSEIQALYASRTWVTLLQPAVTLGLALHGRGACAMEEGGSHT